MTGSAPGLTPAQQVAHAIGLERGLLRPENRGSREVVERLLDPEFREIGASGRLWGRSVMIEAMLADPGTRVITDDEMSGTLVAEGLVMLIYVSAAEGRRARRTSWWRRGRDGRWRILHHQGTPIP
ncbi:MAG: nuclear transport factor 2 family protein [Nocardioides sp.]|nr:nuclear transport factor 2 family protein [Nocardioides sp.]